MQIQKGFQCQSCNSFLSHPIDACPVCSDQFYWMIVPKTTVTGSQQQAFVAAMVNLVAGGVTEEFLTHGGQLWLPYRFWDQDPAGESLAEFSWIDNLELFQHSNNSGQVEPEEKAEPNPWDTVPKMALPDLSKRPEELQAKSAAAASPEIAPEPTPTPSATPRSKPQQDSAPKQAAATPTSKEKPKAKSNEGKRSLFPAHLFVPTMIFLFFLLLSLSYLALRYHKNQMAPLAPTQTFMEVDHERPLLS